MNNAPFDDNNKQACSNEELTACWRTIGINGDNSCPKLEEYIHCRNCPVFSKAGRALLSRQSGTIQVEQWTDKISLPRTETKHDSISVGIFKLGNEYLALPTQAFSEVVNNCCIRKLNHGRDGVLLGLCSIRGEIQLCISLEKILGMQCQGYKERRRFCVLSENSHKWVFPVDSVLGISKINRNDIESTPANTQTGLNLFSSGIFNYNDYKIGLLEANMVFHALARSIK